jgi:hypothetical protein
VVAEARGVAGGGLSEPFREGAGERVAVVCDVSVAGGGGVLREVLRDLSEGPWGRPPMGCARVSVTSAEGRPVRVDGVGWRPL